MAVAAKPVVPKGRGEDAPFDLARETEPAVAIDPEAAEIVAANAAGAAALGLFSYAIYPVALDPAMPAIARLRTIATAPAGQSDVETLLFWSSGRLKRVKCKVTRESGKRGKVLILHILGVETPDGVLPTRVAPPAKLVTAAVPGEKPVQSALPDLTPPALPSKAPSGFDPDIVAKLAHELKTPLTAIAAASEIMRDERLGEMKNARYLSYAADIHESATHALDLITSLLADRGKPAATASRLVALDLGAIVERTVSSVQALAESCGLHLTFEAEESRPHVVANPTALRQVLLNLLTNAIKFTPRGGDVRVRIGRVDDGRVLLVVSDTGCGMTKFGERPGKDSAADLNTPWTRGNGIGLPLVQSLVRDMGAEIHIESAPQKGTTASIYFSDFTRRFK